MQDLHVLPAPQPRHGEPDVLQHVHEHRQAVPVWKVVFQEGLVRPPPEDARHVQLGQHVLEGRRIGPRREDARVHAVEVRKAFIDIRRGAELRIVEQLVHVLQDQRVGVDEDHALIIQLPQPQLGEVVEWGVKRRLPALGEGRAPVQRVLGMSGIELGRGRQQLAADQPGAQGRQRRKLGLGHVGVQDADVGLRAGQHDGPHQRLRAQRIVGVRHQRDKGAVGPRGAVRRQSLHRTAPSQTAFSFLPSGS